MSPTSTVTRLSPKILAAGILTSALALGLEYALSMGADFSLMGLYLMFVVPIGALLVGGLAGVGYGVASWRTGTRISGALMGIVIALQIAVYFVARYIAFSSFDPPLVFQDGTVVGFLDFLDITMQSFAFEDGDPLGAWGYAFGLLEIAGFAAGGVAFVALMRDKPYCAECQRYMTSSTVLHLPASPLGKPPKGKATSVEAQEYQRTANEAFDEGHRMAQAILGGAVVGDLAPFHAARDAHGGSHKDILRSPVRLLLGLERCRDCGKGNLLLNQYTGQGEHVQNLFVGRVELPVEAVASLTAAGS